MVFVRREPKYNLSPVVAKNIEQPYFHENEVYFYTGHGFAKYSIGTQNTVTLSDFKVFPKVISMSITDKNAVFKTDSTYPADDFYKHLKNLGMATDISYWWVTDFGTGQTSLIGEKEGFASKVISAKQAENDLLVAKSVEEHNNKYELLRLKKDKTLNKLNTPSNEALFEIVWAGKDKLIYSSKKDGLKQLGLNIYNFSSQTSEALPDSIGGGNVTISNNGDSIAYQTSSIGDIEENKPDKLGLYFYKIGEKKPKLVSEGFAGIISNDFNGGFLVSGSVDKDKPVIGTVGPDGKLSTFGIKGKSPSISSLGVLVQDSSLIGAIDDSQNLYIISKQNTQFKESLGLPDNINNLSHPAYKINYFNSSKSFSILILQNPYQDNLNLALKDLQNKGVDTNQYEIFARPANNLNPGF